MKAQLFSMVCAVVVLSSCGVEPATSQLTAEHQRNADVTLLSSFTQKNICFLYEGGPGSCSGYDVIKPHLECHEMRRNEGSTYTYFEYDCTAAAAKKYGVPSINRITTSGYKRNDDERITYNNYYWAQEVTGVVRASAYNSDSFAGIGFFNSTVTYAGHEQAPGPRNNDDGQFAKKSDLKVVGSVTHNNGETYKVVKFHSYVQMSHGGSSYVYANYLRPYAKFVANGEEYFNWDNVEDDYLINWRYDFDRSSDVLQ